MNEKVLQELTDTLNICVERSKFFSKIKGYITPQEFKNLYERRGFNETSHIFLSSLKLEIENQYVDQLESVITPIISDFIYPNENRLGNGLFLLLGGGAEEFGIPTIPNFCRMLITGSALLNPIQVATLLLEWVSGEPLRFRASVLLEGVTIDKQIKLGEGIHLSKLPQSERDLPASLPYSHRVIDPHDFMGGIVMSIDCEISPSLYLPISDNHGRISCLNDGRVTEASNRVPNLTFNSFCESLSLACNGHVDWIVKWKDYGNLRAFSLSGSSIAHKPRTNYQKKRLSQEELDQALKIHRARYDCGRLQKNLNLALHRWVRSKKSRHDPDKLIELRIALEALYEIKGTEKAFRLANYGAWHLGEDYEDRRNIRNLLRKAYSEASKVIHAGEIKHPRKDRNMILATQDICRDGILRRLQESEEKKWEDVILGPEN